MLSTRAVWPAATKTLELVGLADQLDVCVLRRCVIDHDPAPAVEIDALPDQIVVLRTPTRVVFAMVEARFHPRSPFHVIAENPPERGRLARRGWRPLDLVPWPLDSSSLDEVSPLRHARKLLCGLSRCSPDRDDLGLDVDPPCLPLDPGLLDPRCALLTKRLSLVSRYFLLDGCPVLLVVVPFVAACVVNRGLRAVALDLPDSPAVQRIPLPVESYRFEQAPAEFGPRQAIVLVRHDLFGGGGRYALVDRDRGQAQRERTRGRHHAETNETLTGSSHACHGFPPFRCEGGVRASVPTDAGSEAAPNRVADSPMVSDSSCRPEASP